MNRCEPRACIVHYRKQRVAACELLDDNTNRVMVLARQDPQQAIAKDVGVLVSLARQQLIVSMPVHLLNE